MQFLSLSEQLTRISQCLFPFFGGTFIQLGGLLGQGLGLGLGPGLDNDDDDVAKGSLPKKGGDKIQPNITFLKLSLKCISSHRCRECTKGTMFFFWKTAKGTMFCFFLKNSARYYRAGP